jgi:hypothetical protein
MPYRIGAKRRKFWLMAASALAPLSLGVSPPALADFECGPSPATCTPLLNPYAGGINYPGSPTDNINLTLLSGVNVVIPLGSSVRNAVNAANSTGETTDSANISINANGTTADPIIITNIANPTVPKSNNTGLRIQSSGDAIIQAMNTKIDVNGTDSNWAILAYAMPNKTGLPHEASVTWSGPQLTTGGMGLPGGNESGGIQATNRGLGNATIDASGNIAVTTGSLGGVNFEAAYGLIARAGSAEINPPGVNRAGDASVTYHSGTINAFGNAPRGIVVWAQGDGSATVKTDPGTFINVRGLQRPRG